MLKQNSEGPTRKRCFKIQKFYTPPHQRKKSQKEKTAVPVQFGKCG